MFCLNLHMYSPCVPGMEAAEGTGYFGHQIADGIGLFCECWALNPGLLLEKQVLLSTETSFQAHEKLSKIN